MNEYSQYYYKHSSFVMSSSKNYKSNQQTENIITKVEYLEQETQSSKKRIQHLTEIIKIK